MEIGTQASRVIFFSIGLLNVTVIIVLQLVNILFLFFIFLTEKKKKPHTYLGSFHMGGKGGGKIRQLIYVFTAPPTAPTYKQT